MVSDGMGTRRATGAVLVFKVEMDALFEGIHIVLIWKHHRRKASPQLCGARKEVRIN